MALMFLVYVSYYSTLPECVIRNVVGERKECGIRESIRKGDEEAVRSFHKVERSCFRVSPWKCGAARLELGPVLSKHSPPKESG